MWFLIRTLFLRTQADPYAALLRRRVLDFVRVYLRVAACDVVMVFVCVALGATQSTWRASVTAAVIVILAFGIFPAVMACYVRRCLIRNPQLVRIYRAHALSAHESAYMQLVTQGADMVPVRVVSRPHAFDYAPLWNIIFVDAGMFARPVAENRFRCFHEMGHAQLGYVSLWSEYMLRTCRAVDVFVVWCLVHGYVRGARIMFPFSYRRLLHAEEHVADAYAIFRTHDPWAGCEALARDADEAETVHTSGRCVDPTFRYEEHPPTSARVADLMTVALDARDDDG